MAGEESQKQEEASADVDVSSAPPNTAEASQVLKTLDNVDAVGKLAWLDKVLSSDFDYAIEQEYTALDVAGKGKIFPP